MSTQFSAMKAAILLIMLFGSCTCDVVGKCPVGEPINSNNCPLNTAFFISNGGDCCAKPVAFIFSDLFEKLSPAEQTEIGQKYLPVDKNQANPKACSSNSQCASEQFCGQSTSLVDGGAHIASDRKYCYAVPKGGVNYVIIPEKVGLLTCDKNKHCEKGTCHKDKTSVFVKALDDGSGEAFKGLCIDGGSRFFMIICIILIGVIIIVLIVGLVVFLVYRASKKSKKPKKGTNASEKPSERTDREGTSSNIERNVDGTGTIKSQKEVV